VASEVALAVLLAIVAGLLTRSFDQLRNLSPGFSAEQVVSARLSPPAAVYGGANTARASAFYEMVIERMSATPGVSAVGIVDRLPIAAPVFGIRVRIQGQFEDGTRLLPLANHAQLITPGYLRALGIPVLRGRSIGDGDRAGAPPVALVSQSFARRSWPGDDPIGKRIGYPYPSPWITVVGVVPDVKLDSLRDTSAVAVLLPFAQRSRIAPAEMSIVVRSNADPEAIARQLRDVVSSMAGAATGCVVALATTRLLASLLYDVSPTDPLTFGTAIGLFVGVAIVASAGPARRATRADPVETLRGA